VFPGNVRKTRDKSFIDELAASIKAHGLQQNLVVKKDGKGFLVVSGGQRLKALQQLAKSGDIEDGYLVPCKVRAGDSDDTEISLAENVMRQDMHPADQFAAFKVLADKGMTAADIGARFGKPESHVLKLLKLARVAPKILTAYRKGELNLEQVMAFTITDDRKAQADVFERMHDRSARQIRHALTEDDIPVRDKRVQFVTLKAYEQRGGTLKRDLFSDDEDGVFITDTALLETLLAERLEKKAQLVRAEGWKWVEIAPDFGYEQRQQSRAIRPEPVPLTPAEQTKLDKLHAEYEKPSAAWEDTDEHEQPPRLVEVSGEIDAIEDREGVWTPEQLALTGPVVTIGHNGKAQIERGLVRPEDMPTKAKIAKGAMAAPPEGNDVPAALPAALVESKDDESLRS
jgi:ParB family chromosome partitioning protein